MHGSVGPGTRAGGGLADAGRQRPGCAAELLLLWRSWSQGVGSPEQRQTGYARGRGFEVRAGQRAAPAPASCRRHPPGGLSVTGGPQSPCPGSPPPNSQKKGLPRAAPPRAPFDNSAALGAGGGEGGFGTRPRYLIVCLWRCLLASTPLLILTLCGPERVLVVSTEPPDDLSCLRCGGGGPTHPNPLPLDPPSPLERLGQFFFRAFDQSTSFFGAFRASQFRTRIFFGAFGASKTPAPPGGGMDTPLPRSKRSPVGFSPHGTL